MRLKTNLKILMDAKGLRSAQLARLSGVPSQRLCDWMAGSSVRNIDQLKRVCEVLEVTLDSILFADITNGKPNENEIDDSLEEQIFMVKIKRVKE